ncbi:MAG: PAS domain-containing protein, partial [Spirochaetaceae bacterium]|nr:PAS domain-containing protein [Spirochaetaceae bacterium]
NLQFKKYIDHEVDTYKCVLRMKHKNGDWIWIQTQGKVFEWDSNGKPLRMAGTHLDITEKKLIEIKLSVSEQRYKSFFDNSPLSLWEHDYTDVISYLDGLIDSNAMDIQILLDNHPEIVKKCVDLVKILDVNPATLKLYNAQCKEDLLRNLSRVFTGQSYKTFKNVLVQIYKRDPIPSRESTNKVLNDKTINVLIESALLSENRYINTVTDITKQKLLETKLTESEQKFRSYFENSPLSLWEEDHADVVKYLQSLPVSGEVELITYLDKNPEAVKKCMGLVKFLNMNQSTLDLYEADSTEMMLNNFSKIFTSSTYESFRAELIFLYKHESYFADQFTDQTLIGRRIDLKFEMRLLSDYRYIVTITNLTELKNKEYRLQELLSQTRAASETKEILLREINHRVKNNLSSLIGILYAEKKKSKNTLEKKQEDLLNNLINRVKGISIAHDLLSRSEWKPISIGLLSEKIINSLKHLIPADRSIKTEISQSSVFLDADQSQSMAVLINELFVNSLEHASQSGGTLKIDINIVEKEGSVYYKYKDNGPGFSKEILASKSFNVGLYLIKNIVELSLRGELTLKNKSGALIIIQFPGGGQIAEI